MFRFFKIWRQARVHPCKSGDSSQLFSGGECLELPPGMILSIHHAVFTFVLSVLLILLPGAPTVLHAQSLAIDFDHAITRSQRAAEHGDHCYYYLEQLGRWQLFLRHIPR